MRQQVNRTLAIATAIALISLDGAVARMTFLATNVRIVIVCGNPGRLILLAPRLPAMGVP